MYQVYKVLPGETLDSLATKFGVSVEDLKKLNGELNNQEISNGYIIVPRGEESLYETYKIQKGDTIYGVAKKYNVSPETLLLLNGLDENDYIYPGEELLLPKQRIYITEEETLDDIHNKTGLSVLDIAKNNNDLLVVANQIIRY